MEVISLYEMEVSPIEILSIMKENIYKYYQRLPIINIDKSYILQRKSLISLIHKISNKMGFKSQTYFLAVNYLDIIFSQNTDILYDYNLLAVGCLIIASKYCENVPLRPIFKYFVSLYNNEIKDEKYKITKDDLFKYEIIICKILNYKLNYYTIYDFNFFFFGNGVIKMEQLKEISYDTSTINTEENNSSSNISNSSQIKRILIKIYERSRHYLDKIIENLICLKYNSLLISICIMEKSIDFVLLNEFNLKNSDNSIDNDEISSNNKEYFKQIMKDFYKLDFDSLIEYQDLKTECENYKLFEDMYDNTSINLNESNNLMKSTQFNSTKNNILLDTNYSSSKNLKVIKDVSFKQSPSLRNNETKDKINFLYRKVNIPVFGQNHINKYNIINIRNKNSPKKRACTSRDNNFRFNMNKKNNTNSKITNLNNFYHKKKDNYRNSTSNNKNNYLKKSNTSSSPFKKVSHFNSSCNKSRLVNKMKINKRIDCSEERQPENNSRDAKKFKKKDKNKNINIAKPYIKKVIHNYEKIQDENNKNININININNKILYGGTILQKDRNKSFKKTLFSKNVNKGNFSLRGKSIVNKSRIENQKNNLDNNMETSPILEKNNVLGIDNQFGFNKNYFHANNISINQYNSNSIYFNDIDNDDRRKNANDDKKDDNEYKTNYNFYDLNLTSRNSFHYPKRNNNLTNSLINIKMTYLNKNINDKNISSSIEYSDINRNKNKNSTKNFLSLNIIRNKPNYLNKRNNEYLNRTNNDMYESNYL